MCTNVILKKDTKIYKKQVREAVLQNRGLGARGIQQAEVGQAVAKGDIWEAQRRAMWLLYANVRSKKAKITWERNPDKHFLEAVGILKQAMDKEDKYLIYKINNSQFNGQPDYVFKSSAPMAQLAIDINHPGLEYPLQGEEAYFDGADPDVQVIKLWHCLSTTQSCIIYLGLQQWRLKVSPHMK